MHHSRQNYLHIIDDNGEKANFIWLLRVSLKSRVVSRQNSGSPVTATN